MELLFWILFAGVFYTYLGYALLMFILTRFLPKVPSTELLSDEELPGLCFFVTAYNEIDIIEEKLKNTLSLNYPKDKLQILFITDGSDDDTAEFIQKYENIEVYHKAERAGKINAMNRGMQFVKQAIVVFTDANTILNKDALKYIASNYRNPKVGCVAGRKSVNINEEANAAGSGEGLYWRFESWLKQLDARFHSVMGAVGELFSIRTELFEKMDSDTILDDFIISLKIAQKGYKISYEPHAIASENASLNIGEEMKRKIRIAAGGVQTIFKMKKLLNIFKYGKLSFQYISHKVTRWTLAPWFLFLLIPVHLLIVLLNTPNNFYLYALLLHAAFYLFVLAGYFLASKNIKYKFIFIPYFFFSINLASILGQIRYFKGLQSAAWEKAKRG